MKPTASLVVFACSKLYEWFAGEMLSSADGRWFPGRSQFVTLRSTPKWPDVMTDRYTHMLANRRRITGDWVFLIDADMLFEGPCDDEILADGISATAHAAMPADMDPDRYTYERDPASVAHIPLGEGRRYYTGAFVGGRRAEFFDLCREITRMIELDGGFVPVWQDESYMNRVMYDQPPALELDERYCTWWNKHVPDARIRAIGKTPEQYLLRETQPFITAA